ncbi:translation initiation factor IF-2, putative, partial [Bodo saltans]
MMLRQHYYNSIKRTLMCGASLCCSSRCLGLSIQTCQRRNASETMSSSSMPLPTVTAEASSLATSVNKVVAPVAVGLDNVAHPFITSNVAPVNLRAQQDAVLPPTTTTAGAMELQSRQRHAAWRRRSLLASKQRFLQHIALHSRVVFSVPSIMDAESFVKFVRHSTQHRLLPLLLKRAASRASTPSSLMSSTSSEDVAALMSITERDVEDVVWRGKESLKSDRSITCMVPYRLAVNMILKRLPPALRAEAIEQLKAAESAKLDEKRQRNAGDLDDEKNILIQWVEADVYGDRDAMRVGSPRTPVYQLLGHTGSGKTTLLRAISSMWEDGDGRGRMMIGSTPVLPTEHLNGVTIARRGGIELASAPELLLSSPLSLSSTLQGGGTARKETPLSSPRMVLAPPPVSPQPPTSTTAYPSAVTLIDTPGHRLFAELRLHTLVAVDAVILVINLAAEGGAVQPQTREAIILALNVDRPIVVAFNKLDMFSDEGTGGRALQAAMKQLKDIGLDVSLVSSVQQLRDILDIDDDMMHQQSSEGQTIRSSSSSSSKWREFVCRQGEIDVNFKGSIRDPSMNLRRRALGVCVSASRGWNVDLFANVLVTTAQLNPPRAIFSDAKAAVSRPCGVQAVCLATFLVTTAQLNPPRAIFSDAKAAVSRPCGVQAVVLDATKQAYQTDDDAAPPPAAADGSGQHHYSRRDGYEASISIRKEKSKEKLNRRRGTTSAKTRIMQEQQYYTYGRGGQSGAQMNPYLFITVVIKSGVLVPGTPFVADQSVGVVEEMLDSYGRVVREAHPGMVVTVVDKHSHCGTPGGGVHLFSLPTSDHAYRVFEHRLLLHRFVSLFPDKTHLLRPRGMDVKHRHLGIYYVPSSSSSSSSAPNVDKNEIAGEAEAVT